MDNTNGLLTCGTWKRVSTVRVGCDRYKMLPSIHSKAAKKEVAVKKKTEPILQLKVLTVVPSPGGILFWNSAPHP